MACRSASAIGHGLVQEKRIIQGAFVVSLLLHLVLAAATWRMPLIPRSIPAMADEPPTEVELFLVPDEAADDPADEMPTAYTAVPERQASETPPEDPDYLAMHHSLAADNKLGGDSDTPVGGRGVDSDQVEIRKEELDGAGGVEYAQQPLPETEAATSPQESGEAGEEQEEVDRRGHRPAGEWALPREDAESGGDDRGRAGRRAGREETRTGGLVGRRGALDPQGGRAGRRGRPGLRFQPGGPRAGPGRAWPSTAISA